MITPQQRNAWRGAYLRQLRKIASTDILLDGWEEEYEFDNALEAHLVHFTLNDFTIILKCLQFVFNSHPIALAYMDQRFIKEDDCLSFDELFAYLQPLSNYTKNHVLNQVICDEGTRQNMMSYLIENDKQSFIELAKTCTNISETCLQCGYVSKAMSPFSKAISLIEEETDEATGDAVMDDLKVALDDRYGTETMDWLAESKDILDLVRQYSMFNLDNLDEELQCYYCLLVKSWFQISQIVDGAFLDKELSIMNDIITRSQSSELFSDIERLTFLLYGFAPERLFTPKSFDIQELRQLKSKMNIKAGVCPPWIKDGGNSNE